MSGVRKVRVPAAPVEAIVAARIEAAKAWRSDAEHLGPGVCLVEANDRRAFYRARCEGGYTIEVADRIATRLGFHPAELWPEWYQLPDHPYVKVPA